MSASQETLPVLELYSAQTRREILSYALSEMSTDEWVAFGIIVDASGKSRESVRKNIDALVAFGVLDIKDPDAKFRHFSLAETDVTELLQAWDGYPLLELFEYSGAQDLVEFFLTQANPEESYSIGAIQRQSTMGRSTVSKHIGTVVDAGLITEVEGARGTEYQLDEDSEIYAFLRELNEALYETYQQRTPIE